MGMYKNKKACCDWTMVLFNLANISQTRLSRKIPLRNKLASQWSSNHFPIPTPRTHRCMLITVCTINVIALFHIPEPSTHSHTWHLGTIKEPLLKRHGVLLTQFDSQRFKPFQQRNLRLDIIEPFRSSFDCSLGNLWRGCALMHRKGIRWQKSFTLGESVLEMAWKRAPKGIEDTSVKVQIRAESYFLVFINVYKYLSI